MAGVPNPGKDHRDRVQSAPPTGPPKFCPDHNRSSGGCPICGWPLWPGFLYWTGLRSVRSRGWRAECWCGWTSAWTDQVLTALAESAEHAINHPAI